MGEAKKSARKASEGSRSAYGAHPCPRGVTAPRPRARRGSGHLARPRAGGVGAPAPGLRGVEHFLKAAGLLVQGGPDVPPVEDDLLERSAEDLVYASSC